MDGISYALLRGVPEGVLDINRDSSVARLRAVGWSKTRVLGSALPPVTLCGASYIVSGSLLLCFCRCEAAALCVPPPRAVCCRPQSIPGFGAEHCAAARPRPIAPMSAKLTAFHRLVPSAASFVL